ncbi:IclR family transcriptional regulator [Pseudoxanthobacter sp.]|uniref:IclR family transcriptional regulator n=1 Tax=Pseudoxanthobacter sp. TaxID=1925742 RepID=UPI002FE31AEE
MTANPISTASSRPGSEEAPPGTQTLMRGLAVLEAVAAGTTDVAGLSARLGMTRSTAHRTLAALVAAGYLASAAHGRYRLGSRLIRLGLAALEEGALAGRAEPFCRRLAETTGDTVHFGVPEGSDVVYLAKVPGGRGLEMRSRVGQRMRLARTGLGKALLLGTDEGRWPALYQAAADGGPPLPPYADWRAGLLADRARGFTFDLEENEPGIRCVGAPVRDASGRVIAALSVASAVPFMPPARMIAIAPDVVAVAGDLSRELGWTA